MAKAPTTEADALDALHEESEEDKDSVKCDNHPQRKARTFTGGGAFKIHLCDECTPSWFKPEE